MIRVAVDALGGDRAPEEIVHGAVDARSEAIEPILFGPAGVDTHGLTLVETTQAIEMDDHPVESVRSKTDSSLVRAVRAVADGDADVVVSAGNTGAMLAASLLHIRRARMRTPARSISSSSHTWARCSRTRSSRSSGPRSASCPSAKRTRRAIS
jgi:glycerol-3-phosphate acyltransferase PlsX